MNGYVEKDGQKFLWIGKRSDVKQTYPGMLDHLVAGGLVCIPILLLIYCSNKNICWHRRVSKVYEFFQLCLCAPYDI